TTIGTVTTNSAGTLLLTFNSSATTALVNSALQQIAYPNSSDTPPASAQIDWSFDDGNIGSQGTGGALQGIGSTTVTITATNDDPTNAGTLPTDIAMTEDVVGNVDLSAIDLSDVDEAGGNITVTLTTSTGGNLTATTGGGVTIGGSGTGVLTLDGTLADLNTFLDTASNITYLHGTPGTNGDDADTIQANVNDNGNTGTGGGTDIDLGTVNVDIGSANNAPTFSVAGDGIGTDPIGTGDESGSQVVIQPDGKMVVGGHSWNGTDYDFAVTRYNTDGSLDSSFGTGGTAVTAVTARDDHLTGVALQADGKILATGYDHNGSAWEYIVVRYDSDGNLDTSFDGDGIVITDPGGGGRAHAITVQDDGQIVVVGDSYGVSNEFTVVRYNTNGSPDSGFGGGDGITITDLFGAGQHDYAKSVAIQSDGKILVSGGSLGGATSYDSVLARYDTDGTLDTSFGGGNGYVMTEVGGFDISTSTLVQTDGKIVVTGYTDNDIALVRYNSDGTLDTGYGTGGKVISDLSGNDDKGYAAALQADGKIVVAGYSNNGVDNDFMLARYDTDGSLDTSFGGGDGFTTTAIGSGDDIARSLALQADGKIVLAGQSSNGSNDDFAYARYNSDGTLDTTFDSVPLNTLNGTPSFTEGGA
ncbi:MAG: hypothetical protein GY802_02845, partial [Gammaproteobacteria bacterium]|nr:hypothetical protein [Gammaproteobacteria bacterium]